MKSSYLGPVLCALIVLISISPGSADARGVAKPVPVSEAELRESIAVLASDDFGGRKPGTEGETKTIAYIADAFWKAGLTGGADAASGWYAPVDLVRSAPLRGSLTLKLNGKPLVIGNDEVLVFADVRSSELGALPVVYTGYGVDGDGNVIGEVRGALAIVEAGEPSYLPGSERMRGFESRAQALRDAGAKAVLGILSEETSFAELSSGLMARERTRLATAPGSAVQVTGLASKTYVTALFNAAGADPEVQAGAAISADYRGAALNVTADLSTANRTSDLRSYNVIAKLPGTDPRAGAVMFMGHWDHLGTCRPEGAEDRICNGAVDNASGIAVLIAVAKRLATMERFERDIYFVATTAEEIGLLGAYAMAENPPVPLDRIVVALNVDTIAIAGRDAKVAIIGRGKTDLDDDVDRIARSLGRDIDKSDEANAFIRRQDGWALAQRDVPALMVGGSFSDAKLLEAFLSGPYHGPDDELTDATPLGGAAEDADLHVALGAYFADADAYRPKAKD